MTGRRALGLAFAGMGVTAAVIPASLPSRAAELGVSSEGLAAAIPALFGGLLIGVLLTPLLVRQSSSAAVVRIGAFIQFAGLGLAALALAAPVLVAAAGIAGSGFGMVEASGTIAARRLASTGLARLLARLTAAVAVMAAAAPLLIVAAAPLRLERAVLAAGALLQLAVAVLLRSPREQDLMPAPAPLRPALIPFAVALFCYVGTESLLSGWSAIIVQHAIGAAPTIAAVGTSAFWVLMFAGRRLAARLLPDRPSRIIPIAALAAISVLLVGAALADGGSSIAGLALMAVAVLVCGPSYALLVGSGLHGVEDQRVPGTTATLIAAGATGGTVVPLIATAASAGTGVLPWIGAGAAALAAIALSRSLVAS